MSFKMRVAAAVGMLLSLFAGSVSAQDSAAWSDIRASLYNVRPVAETSPLVRIVAPKRAEDAAVVAVSMTVAAEAVPRVRSLTLIVDNNPAPVVATINFADAYRKGGDVGDRTVELRIRLDQLSPVRAILELEDGSLHMASQFVAGSGGCTSTSVKDVDQAILTLGQTRLKVASDRTRGESWREVQAQIRHPNFSGMQIDAKTNSYTPAHFVDRVEFRIGGKMLAAFETGIAISEDPNIRMSFASASSDTLTMTARDTMGHEFSDAATAHEATN